MSTNTCHLFSFFVSRKMFNDPDTLKSLNKEKNQVNVKRRM